MRGWGRQRFATFAVAVAVGMLLVIGGLVLMGVGHGPVVAVGVALWVMGSLVIGRFLAFMVGLADRDAPFVPQRKRADWS